MNKKLLVVAVATALSAPAMAQNVSVYGVIDTGFQSYDNGTASISRPADGNFSTSRLGFKGSEDLGGGLKAEFKMEARLNPSLASNGSTLFNRGLNVTVSGGFGSITIGQNDTSDTQDIDALVGQGGNFTLRPAMTNATGTAISNTELGSDVDGVIRFKSASFNGFQVEVGFGSGNSNSKVADQSADIVDYNIRYANGPLLVIAGKTTKGNATAADETSFTAFGASYDFGAAKVGLTTSSADANFATGKMNTTVLSASAPIGNGMTVFGGYAKGEIKALANGKGSGTVVGLKKDLSKRTSLYGAYTASNAEAGAGFTFAGTTFTTSTTGLGTDQKAITVGITHSF